MTFVAKTEDGKLIPNPNVMVEYGYALRAKSESAMMPIMNTALGPPKELPFDMGHLRHPIQYEIESVVPDSERRAERSALSQKIERHLREQIASTQPPPPAPTPFQPAKAEDGPARFRPPGHAIGKRWDHIPVAHLPRQAVSLVAGPAMWLRVMPTVDPGKKWPIETLTKSAMPPGRLNLEPFHIIPGAHFCMIAEDDGMGLCSLIASNSVETPSVAYAFRTGEVWRIDAIILSYHPGILVGEIETLYADRLVSYSQFLLSLGLQPPFHWIAGITNVKGRRLQIPLSPNATQPSFPGPECLSRDITAEGMYDSRWEAGSALTRFFDAIYEECGRTRPSR